MSCREYRIPPKLSVCLKGDTLHGETSRKCDSFQHIQKEKLWLVAAVMRHFVLTTIFPFHPLPFRRHWQINFVVMWHDDVLVLQIWSLRAFLVVCLTAQTAMASTSVGSQRILVYYESQVWSFFWKLEMTFRLAAFFVDFEIFLFISSLTFEGWNYIMAQNICFRSLRGPRNGPWIDRGTRKKYLVLTSG